MTFSMKDLFCKCDQIRSFLRIWSYLLKKSLMENFSFCVVNKTIWSTSKYYQYKDSVLNFKKSSSTEVEKVMKNAQIEHC